jgi:hypothetical protein
MVHCAGCHSNFSVSGYTHHLRLTQSSACAAAYHAQLEHENDVDIEEDHDMPALSGDFFGNYDDKDFNWPDGLLTVNTSLIPTDNCTGDNEEYFDVQAPASNTPAQDPRFEVEPFPLATAGAPIPGSVCGASSFVTYGSRLSNDEEYAPFCSKIDWDIVRWAKLRGPSSSAVSELLEIDGVRFRRGYFKSVMTLYCS